jgi:Holliday junction resolvasome RuvABC DNA-binding subunit
VRATARINAAGLAHAISRDTSARDQDARDALSAAGYKPSQGRAAVEHARPHVGSDGTLEQLIREALRCCTR